MERRRVCSTFASRRTGRRLLIGALAAVVGLAARAAAQSGAGTDDASQLLTLMRQALEPGRDMRASFTLAVAGRDGQAVTWSGRLVRRTGPDARLLLVFDHPADLRETEVSVARAANDEIHTRVYLPAIRRVRDIEADARGESFLGTDFNYEDLGLEPIAFQRHTVTGEDTVNGTRCRKVESVPERGWWYGKIVRCLDPQTHLPVRTDYYDRNGILWKTRTIDTIATVQGHPTATSITMTTVPARTSTKMVLTDVRYDTGLGDDAFAGPSRLGDGQSVATPVRGAASPPTPAR
jgi:hypothetical protein